MEVIWNAIKNRIKDIKMILDVATGEGYFVNLICKNISDFTSIIGIDPNENAIAKASKLYTNSRIKFHKSKAENIPYGNDMFDMVSISRALHHLGDRKAAMSEMYRVLRPGGVLIINEMIRDEQNEAQITRYMYHHLGAEIDRLAGMSHNETLTRYEIKQLVGNFRFSKISFLEYNEPDIDLFNISEIERIEEVCDKISEKFEDERIKEKSLEIKGRLWRYGIQNPTQFIVIAEK
ncbi:MAG: Demethylrebeccamycin-D-glucose O-methyltransferase [Firmicutes bacterium ADurb.Bin419]|nr:MAG: Demethylrebeccamycin-D-glucose O-methyltransferase [Firmicutes bacterium ADurb.Bin419]